MWCITNVFSSKYVCYAVKGGADISVVIWCLLHSQIADAMYPPWYLVQIMIALAHIIPKAKLVTNRDIAEIGFRDLVKRKRVCDLRFNWCTTHFFVCSLLLLIGVGH
jgi:hypothetical protein